MKKTVRIILFVLLLSVVSCANNRENHDREYRVRFKTNYGDIVVKLYNDTPVHRDNFLKLVNRGFYNGVLFHRVIGDFMIQAGDPLSKNAQPGEALGLGDLDYTIPPEIVYPAHYHKRGALAAARDGDDINPGKESSGCQFYIVWGKKISEQELKAEEKSSPLRRFNEQQRNDYRTVGGVPHLDNEYTVFGEVVKGLDVVWKISKAKTDLKDRPVEDVRIISAKVL